MRRISRVARRATETGVIIVPFRLRESDLEPLREQLRDALIRTQTGGTR